MDPADAVEELFSSGAVGELHELLWIEPRVLHGVPDGGWHCREHAVVLGALLVLAGIPLKVVNGRCLFVQRPQGSGEALAIGQGPGEPTIGPFGHTWLEVEGLGILDLSPNFASPAPPWLPIASRGVIGESWGVEGLTARVVKCRNMQEYDAAIVAACEVPSTATAIYLTEDVQPLRSSMFLSDFLASPETDRARLNGGSDVFLKLVGYLREFADARTRRNLSKLNRKKAWRILGSRPPAEVREIQQALDDT